MYLTPRKAEIDAVAEILNADNSEEFDNAEDMARHVIKVVAQFLSERDSYGVHAYFARRWANEGAEPYGLSIGPFYDRRDAVKASQDAREAGMEARIGRLSGSASIKPPETLQGVICECGHRKELHPKADRCKTLPTCPCRGFVNAP
jgi:hypothetical protein